MGRLLRIGAIVQVAPRTDGNINTYNSNSRRSPRKARSYFTPLCLTMGARSLTTDVEKYEVLPRRKNWHGVVYTHK